MSAPDQTELLGLLRKAVEKVRSTTLRAEQAEARMQAMGRKAEEILASVEGELDEALTGRHDAETRAAAAEASLAAARAQAALGEERAAAAEQRAAVLEAELREAEGRIARAVEALTAGRRARAATNGVDHLEPLAVVH